MTDVHSEERHCVPVSVVENVRMTLLFPATFNGGSNNKVRAHFTFSVCGIVRIIS